MKRTFVLDENVFIFAHTLENEHKQIDKSSANLIVAVIHYCHALALSAELHSRYVRKVGQLRLASNLILGGSVLSLINKTSIVNPDKLPIIPTPDLEDMTIDDAVPHKDHFLIKLVLRAGAILVTTDGPLRDALRIPRIASLYNIEPMRPEEALPHATTN